MYDTPMNSCMFQLQLPSSTTLIISRMVPMPIRNRYSRSPTRYLHSSVPNSSRITVSSHLIYRKANWLVRMMRSPGGSLMLCVTFTIICSIGSLENRNGSLRQALLSPAEVKKKKKEKKKHTQYRIQPACIPNHRRRDADKPHGQYGRQILPHDRHDDQHHG